MTTRVRIEVPQEEHSKAIEVHQNAGDTFTIVKPGTAKEFYVWYGNPLTIRERKE